MPDCSITRAMLLASASTSGIRYAAPLPKPAPAAKAAAAAAAGGKGGSAFGAEAASIDAGRAGGSGARVALGLCRQRFASAGGEFRPLTSCCGSGSPRASFALSGRARGPLRSERRFAFSGAAVPVRRWSRGWSAPVATLADDLCAGLRRALGSSGWQRRFCRCRASGGPAGVAGRIAGPHGRLRRCQGADPFLRRLGPVRPARSPRRPPVPPSLRPWTTSAPRRSPAPSAR